MSKRTTIIVTILFAIVPVLLIHLAYEIKNLKTTREIIFQKTDTIALKIDSISRIIENLHKAFIDSTIVTSNGEVTKMKKLDDVASATILYKDSVISTSKDDSSYQTLKDSIGSLNQIGQKIKIDSYIPDYLHKPLNDSIPLEKDSLIETVKRGGHMLEIRKGIFIAANRFAKFDHAEERSDQLFNRGFHSVKVNYVTEKEAYYVTLFDVKDLTTARSELNRIKQMDGLKNVWIVVAKD